MATTTIVPGNVYVTTGTVSGNIITHTPKTRKVDGIDVSFNKAVEIFSARIEFNYINAIGGLLFKSVGDTGEDKPRRIRDLKKIQKVITITGFLDDQPSLRAITKRNDLLEMGEFERALTLVWGRGNYRTIFLPSFNKGVFILKQRFRETAGIYGTLVSTADPQPLTKYDVEIQFITGRDL